MSKHYRPLLPATTIVEGSQPESSSSNTSTFPLDSATTISKKRPQTLVACEFCRRRKSRCDGKRPACTSCQKQRRICVYPPEDPRAVVLARVKSKLEVSEQENDHLRKLLNLVGQLPVDQARQVISQFNNLKDPTALLEGVQGMIYAAQHIPEIDMTSTNRTSSSPRALAVDLKALTSSLFKVPARPWTMVAGDGIVSDLISSFFVWDDAFFFPFIDREAFLTDMRSGDVQNSKFCSPFLVNAICASRCFTSQAVKALGAPDKDIGTKFWYEAKRTWALEGDRPSIPSVQALGIMFTVSAFKGQDRLGSVYRYASYNMLNRLDLPGAYATAKEVEQRRYSKISWGLFCFESIVAYVYLQQSLIPPPIIPRNFNLSSETVPPDSPLPGHVPGILEATCQLSELLYKVMQHNNSTDSPGSEQDLSTRKHTYLAVTKWLKQLPPQLSTTHNFTAQTTFLHMFVDEVFISILRPLHHTTLLSWTTSPTTVRALLFQYAVDDAVLSKRFIETFSLQEYSCMTLCGLYNSILIIVQQLDDLNTHAIFTDICMMIRQTANDFPMAHLILQAVFALACQLDLPVPARAMSYIQEPSKNTEQLQDLPLGFVIPQTDVIKSLLLTTRDEGESDALVDMGTVLAKWSRMSI